jgi:large subunit ribosomal protein L31
VARACHSKVIWYDSPPLNVRAPQMKAEIHPKYEEITATCSCGNVIKTRSTNCEDMHLEVCSNCHPFYTGKQKVIDSAGRIDRFNKRFKRGS